MGAAAGWREPSSALVAAGVANSESWVESCSSIWSGSHLSLQFAQLTLAPIDTLLRDAIWAESMLFPAPSRCSACACAPTGDGCPWFGAVAATTPERQEKPVRGAGHTFEHAAPRRPMGEATHYLLPPIACAPAATDPVETVSPSALQGALRE